MVRELDFATEADMFGQLRFDVFHGQLGWPVGDASRRVEFDKLDVTADHLGCIGSDGRLEAYARVIQGGSPGGLLLQQPVFAPLFPPGLVVDATMGEVSRLCVRPGRLPTDQPTDAEVVRLIVRAIYDLAMSRGIVTLYATTSDTMSGYINKWFLEHLSFVVKAGPYQFESSINTYLMALDVVSMSSVPFAHHYLKL